MGSHLTCTWKSKWLWDHVPYWSTNLRGAFHTFNEESKQLYYVILYLKMNHYLFFLIYGAHKSFSWGHRCPCFRLLVISALGFNAKVDPFLHAFLPVGSSDSPMMWHLLTLKRSAWQLSLFRPCLQALVEVQAKSRTHDRLCGDNGSLSFTVQPFSTTLMTFKDAYYPSYTELNVVTQYCKGHNAPSFSFSLRTWMPENKVSCQMVVPTVLTLLNCEIC